MRTAAGWSITSVLRAGRWRPWLWQCAASTAALAVVVALLRPARLDLGLINIALLLLLLSVASAAAWGWVVGLYTSLLSNLAFNFFFVPPLYRLSVQQPAHALALALFLVVAAISASLLAARRQSALEAARRARDTQTLLTLSRTMRDLPPEAIPAAICAWVVRDFPVRACTLYRLEQDALRPIAHTGEGSADHDQAYLAAALTRAAAPAGHSHHPPAANAIGEGTVASDACLLVRLAVENETLGVLCVQPGAEPLRGPQPALLEAFAGEAAAALHRNALSATAGRAAVLQESDRLKSALLSSVSHDLRTPLTAIKTAAANLLSADVQWSEAARQEFLGAIDREADRLTRLVANLLDLSRIEAGALRLDEDWNDLEELLREAVYRAERAAPDRAIRLAVPSPLPFLRFDYVQIDRVVSNLLENAIKYSPPGAPVAIGVALEAGLVRVSIRDHGAGIGPGERERVFNPFYRAERRGPQASGSGLGLAICRGIVAAHGGEIGAADCADGALLTFTLPREPLGDPFTVFATPLAADGAVATEPR